MVKSKKGVFSFKENVPYLMEVLWDISDLPFILSKDQTKLSRYLAKELNAPISWASTRENLSSGVCEQHRRRPACASAQSDQRLCYSRFGKYYMQTCYR